MMMAVLSETTQPYPPAYGPSSRGLAWPCARASTRALSAGTISRGGRGWVVEPPRRGASRGKNSLPVCVCERNRLEEHSICTTLACCMLHVGAGTCCLRNVKV